MADGHTERPKNGLYKSALAYARYGYKIFPLVPEGKMPLTKHGVKEASTDEKQVNKWWSVHRDANIGVATGDGLLVLDIDGPKGAETLERLEEEHGKLPPTPCQITGKGKHYLFSVDVEVRNTAGKVGYRGERDEDGKKVSSGIDTRGDGGYIVICPSIHPTGAKYQWDGDNRPSKTPLAPAPAWLIDEMTRQPKISEQAAPVAPVTSSPQDAPNVSKYVDKAVENELQNVAQAGKGTRNHALNSAAFNLGTFVGAGALQESYVSSALLNAATACGLVAEDGQPACLKTIKSGMDAGIQNPRTLPEPRAERPKQSTAAEPRTLSIASSDGKATEREPLHIYKDSEWINGEEPTDWVLNGDGFKQKRSLHNALLHLRHERKLAKLFALDIGSKHIVVTRKADWDEHKHDGYRLINDADIVALCCHFEKHGLNISFENSKRLIKMAAQENQVDPAREALEVLEWDETPRLDLWMVDYLGVEDTSFNRQAGAKWIISGVARILKPGCKVDTMLVLEGPQGARKSSALSTIAGALGDHYFTDRISKLDGKDAVIELQGNVIIEIAELDAFKGAQVSTIKAFLSRQFDKIRLPWDATITELERRCIFAGTVNPGGAGWMDDSTGGRRFWPAAVSHVDIQGLKEIAPQLWAEALHRFNEGEEWWITDPVVLKEAERAVEDRYNEDPWAPLIEDHARGMTQVDIQRVFEIIDVPKERWTKAARNRVGSQLRRMGFRNHPVRVDGRLKKVWIRDEPYGIG